MELYGTSFITIITQFVLDHYYAGLPDFQPVILNTEKPKTVFVTIFKASVSRLEGERTFAIVMNANSVEEATDIDYFGGSKDLFNRVFG